MMSSRNGGVVGVIFVSVMLLLVINDTESTVFSKDFVGTNGTMFMLNGASFAFNGFNSYWLMQVATYQRPKVSNVMKQAQGAGLTVGRTWAFSDGGDRPLQKSPGVYDENFFQALDFVISEAKKYSIKLILSLGNNYKDFGGKHQYVEWAKAAGQNLTCDDDFYTNPLVKTYYKNNIKTILTRMNTVTKIAYRDDPTIMAWELLNEPRCDVDATGKTVTAWIQEMASYLKSIDSKHLLGVGLEGFYGDSTPDRVQYNPKSLKYGTDFIAHHLVQQLDFASFHAYADIWFVGESDQTQMDFLDRWLKVHWTDSANILKKPLVFGEFGKSKKNASIEVRDKFMDTLYGKIYNFAKSGGTIGGGLVWQIMDVGMDTYFDGYEIVLPLNPSTSSIIYSQSMRMSHLPH